MAGQLAEAYVEVSARTGKFQAALNDAVRHTQIAAGRMQGNLAKVADNWGGTFRSIGISFGSMLANMAQKVAHFAAYAAAALAAVGVGIAAAVTKTVVEFDSLERGLTAVMGSAEAAKAEMEKLREVAKLPGLGLPEAVQGSTNLQAAGMSADEARAALQAFGNALATVGKGKAELEGVQTALVQIISKGKVSAEEINQLSERLPQVRVAMKDAFGTADTEALQAMGLDAKDFVNRLTAEFAKLTPVTGGLKNAWENAMDDMTVAMLSLKEAVAPVVEWVAVKLSDVFTKISEWAEKNGPTLERWGAMLIQTFQLLARGTSDFVAGLLGIENKSGDTAGIINQLIETFNRLGQWWATRGWDMGQSIRKAFLTIAFVFNAAKAGALLLTIGIIHAARAASYLFTLLTKGLGAAKKDWKESGDWVRGFEKELKETGETMTALEAKLKERHTRPTWSPLEPFTPGGGAPGTAPGSTPPASAIPYEPSTAASASTAATAMKQAINAAKAQSSELGRAAEQELERRRGFYGLTSADDVGNRLREAGAQMGLTPPQQEALNLQRATVDQLKTLVAVTQAQTQRLEALGNAFGTPDYQGA